MVELIHTLWLAARAARQQVSYALDKLRHGDSHVDVEMVAVTSRAREHVH